MLNVACICQIIIVIFVSWRIQTSVSFDVIWRTPKIKWGTRKIHGIKNKNSVSAFSHWTYKNHWNLKGFSVKIRYYQRLFMNVPPLCVCVCFCFHNVWACGCANDTEPPLNTGTDFADDSQILWFRINGWFKFWCFCSHADRFTIQSFGVLPLLLRLFNVVPFSFAFGVRTIPIENILWMELNAPQAMPT